VLSVALARQSALSGPLLSDVLGDWFQTHPRVEIAPPYEMPPETPGLVATPQAPPFQVIMAAPMFPRYWLVSPDDQELVQVQTNYLAINWRRRDATHDYPGYDEMRTRFVSLLQTAESGLSRHQGTLKPTRVELTYINLLHPDNIWSSHEGTHKIVALTVPNGLDYERLSFTYSQALVDSEKQFSGRLHVVLNPAVDWIKQEPQLILTLTARSADLADQNIDAALHFLDLAHIAAEDSFHRLISEAARQVWGLT